MRTARVPVVPIVGKAVTVDLREVASAVIRAVKTFAADRKVSVVNDVRECAVRGDRAAVLALVRELVVVAIERSPRHAEVTVSADGFEGGILLRVIDRGSDSSTSQPRIKIPIWYEPRQPSGRAACACLTAAIVKEPSIQPRRGRPRTTYR